MKTGIETFRLHQREDHVTGETGWCITNLADITDEPMVANDAYLIAHDIVEHVNGIEEIGGIAEEFEALGGVWQTRGRFFDIRRDNPYNVNDSYLNIAGDVDNLWLRYLGGEEFGREYPNLSQVNSDDLEFYREDIDSILESWDEMRDTEEDYTSVQLAKFIRTFRMHFVLGALKHREQYGTNNHANQLFYNLVDELNEVMSTTHLETYSEIILEIDYDSIYESKIYAANYWEEGHSEYSLYLEEMEEAEA